MADAAVDFLSESAEASSETSRRERSTIEFPYTDLDDAHVIAKSVHSLGGTCEWNTLAGLLKATPDGGAFRSRMSAARMFGFVKWEKAAVELTDLGMRVCDPQQERAARAESFLLVPLYSKIFGQFNGKTLPPVSGLESFIGNVGVATKQKERARQAFQRSAKQAGFFDFGLERLVKPAIGKVLPPPSSPTPADVNREKPPGNTGERANPGGEPKYDPLIEGLLRRLPKPEEEWKLDARKRWLQAASNIFDVMYTDEESGKTIVIECKTNSSTRDGN